MRKFHLCFCRFWWKSKFDLQRSVFNRFSRTTGLFLYQTMYLIIMKCVTDNTISVESIKTLYESEFPRHMKYHNPVKCMSDTHSFDIFSFKHKKNKILNNRKVVTQWDLSKSEVFSTTDHYSGRKTIKTENKQTVFLEDEPIIRNFRTIGKFLLKKSVFGVFLKFSYPEGVKSYIIKTVCWFLVEADQTYLTL